MPAVSKGKAGLVLLLFVLLIGAGLVIAYKKGLLNGFFGKKINSPGADPNPADCGNFKSSGQFMAAGEVVCTAPLYKTGKIAFENKTVEVKERCFTLAELQGIEPGEGTSIGLPYPYNYTKWHYNKQMGDKFCFVDNTDYACDKFNCNP